MDTRIFASLLFLFLLFIHRLDAQPGGSIDPLIPLQQNRSVLFEKDIVIHDQPIQNQRKVTIRSAFNGWLYAGYSYIDDVYHYPSITILKSIDNGITWTLFVDMHQPFDNSYIGSFDITVCGDSNSNIKLFLAFGIVVEGSAGGIGDGHVLRFNGSTGVYEDEVQPPLFSAINVSLASDCMFPAINSNPYSLGCLYSSHYYLNNTDSIIFRSSDNGGMYFDNQRVLAGTGEKFRKVALTYGRGLSTNSGQYFAVWEEKNTLSSNTGHIFTAYSDPDFNSPFTTPEMLDSLDPTAYNNARNPSIACQYNNIDNDSSNLTEIVLFDKYLPSSNSYDIQGCYNMKSTINSHFIPFSLGSSSESRMEPSISFNPFDSTFIVTYYNSTSQQLPFLRKNFNMINPDSWQVITPGYNDSSNLIDPYPIVALNIGQKQGVMAWTSEGTDGNGISLFDAPYLITGISKTDNNAFTNFFMAYPNPCSTSLKVAFQLARSEIVTITLYNLIGQSSITITNQIYRDGKYIINHDVSILPPGSYLLSCRTETTLSTRKLLIIR